MAKFKVGDKVRVRQWDDMKKEFGALPWGTIKVKCGFTTEMKQYCHKVVTITSITSNGYHIKEDGGEWYYSDDMFEPQAQSIVIYRKDNKVIALDKATGETAEAICNADDEFDFYVGADLAFERLRGRKPAPKTREEAPKYFTGEMICIKSASKYYTLGKIYKVKNGQWKDNDGDMNTIRYESIEHINRKYDSQFIEVVR